LLLASWPRDPQRTKCPQTGEIVANGKQCSSSLTGGKYAVHLLQCLLPQKISLSMKNTWNASEKRQNWHYIQNIEGKLLRTDFCEISAASML